MSLVINEMTFGKPRVKVTACQGTQLHNLEVGTLNPNPWSLRGREGLEAESVASGQQLSQSCLGNAVPIKPQRLEFKELGWCTCGRWEEWCA